MRAPAAHRMCPSTSTATTHDHPSVDWIYVRTSGTPKKKKKIKLSYISPGNLSFNYIRLVIEKVGQIPNIHYSFMKILLLSPNRVFEQRVVSITLEAKSI